MTHNHPSWRAEIFLKQDGTPTLADHGGSLSKGDVVTAFEWGLKEIRAVAGSRVYKLRLEKDWVWKKRTGSDMKASDLSKSDEFSFDTFAWDIKRTNFRIEMNNEYRFWKNKGIDKYRADFEKGKYTRYQGAVLVQHYIWENMFKDSKGIKYSYEKRK